MVVIPKSDPGRAKSIEIGSTIFLDSVLAISTYNSSRSVFFYLSHENYSIIFARSTDGWNRLVRFVQLSHSRKHFLP